MAQKSTSTAASMSSRSRRPILAASIAVFREGRVLLASRTKPPAADLFSLPGGHVEAGETLAQAALRELREEVDVEAEIIGFNDHVEIFETEPDGRLRRHFVVASFAGRWLAGEGTPGPEAGRVVWIDPSRLSDVATTPHLADIVARAHRMATA